ncbi:MAG: hypothetical protein QOE96_502 [Blastocatellia bacterium]|nr:hypothetical protein [Blastocatellia bacterium]
MSQHRWLIVTALMASIFGAMSAAQAEGDSQEYIVTGITGRAMADGRVLTLAMKVRREAAFNVPAGSKLTLLTRSISIAIDGAFQGELATSPPPEPALTGQVRPSFWYSLLESVLQFAGRGPPSAENDDPWAIRIDTPGAKCLRAGQPAKIEVDSTYVGRRASIANVAEDQSATVRLSAAIVAWPSGLDLRQNVDYEAAIDGSGTRERWRIAFLDAPLDPGEASLRQLLDRGCTDQVLRFAQKIRPDVVIKKE